jgi:hypothetical protein
MANRDDMSFSKAFADARREMGGGKTFTWRGNRYTTDLAEETPRRAGRSVDEIARSASAAIDRAEDERRPRPNPRRGMTESPRPQANPRRSDVATSVSTPSITAEPISRNRRDAQDASPTTRARAPVRRDAQDMPPSISRVIASAPDAAARADAERVAREGLDKRMPLQNLLRRIRDSIRTRREGASSTNAASRSEAAAAAASARREAAQAGRERRAAGMDRGGLVKSGNTDRRGNGMFYDSKSPRGYK